LKLKIQLNKVEPSINVDSIAGKEILRIIKKQLSIEQKEVLFYLLEEGAIKTITAATDIADYEFSIIKDKLESLDLSIFAESKDDFYLIASKPSGLIVAGASSIRPLYSEIISLIVNANKEICITNPFFDKEGLAKIIPWLKAAAQRKIKIKVLLRSDSPEKFKNYLLQSLDSSCEARNFGGKGYHLHAKFIIVDSKKAYLGSANLTKYSLGENLELGIIFSGKKVLDLKSLFESVWKISDKL